MRDERGYKMKKTVTRYPDHTEIAYDRQEPPQGMKLSTQVKWLAAAVLLWGMIAVGVLVGMYL